MLEKIINVPMMLDICDKSLEETVKLFNILHNVYVILLVAVPILLIIFGVIDLAKAVTQGKEEDIKKGQKALITRIIAGLLVFFVAAIVGFLIKSFVGTEGDMATVSTCLDMFINGPR